MQYILRHFVGHKAALRLHNTVEGFVTHSTCIRVRNWRRNSILAWGSSTCSFDIILSWPA